MYPEATFSPQDTGADDAADSDVDGAGVTDLFTAAPGANHDVDAGVVPASIGDFVFVDLDDDGLQDAGELGVGV